MLIGVPVRCDARFLEERGGLAEIVGRLGEHRLELVEPLIDRILTPIPGRPFELGDCRVERMVLVMRRAERAQEGVRFAAQSLDEALGET